MRGPENKEFLCEKVGQIGPNTFFATPAFYHQDPGIQGESVLFC